MAAKRGKKLTQIAVVCVFDEDTCCMDERNKHISVLEPVTFYTLHCSMAISEHLCERLSINYHHYILYGANPFPL